MEPTNTRHIWQINSQHSLQMWSAPLDRTQLHFLLSHPAIESRSGLDTENEVRAEKIRTTGQAHTINNAVNVPESGGSWVPKVWGDTDVSVTLCKTSVPEVAANDSGSKEVSLLIRQVVCELWNTLESKFEMFGPCPFGLLTKIWTFLVFRRIHGRNINIFKRSHCLCSLSFSSLSARSALTAHGWNKPDTFCTPRDLGIGENHSPSIKPDLWGVLCLFKWRHSFWGGSEQKEIFTKK